MRTIRLVTAAKLKRPRATSASSGARDSSSGDSPEVGHAKGQSRRAGNQILALLAERQAVPAGACDSIADMNVGDGIDAELGILGSIVEQQGNPRVFGQLTDLLAAYVGMEGQLAAVALRRAQYDGAQSAAPVAVDRGQDRCVKTMLMVGDTAIQQVPDVVQYRAEARLVFRRPDIERQAPHRRRLRLHLAIRPTAKRRDIVRMRLRHPARTGARRVRCQ